MSSGGVILIFQLESFLSSHFYQNMIYIIYCMYIMSGGLETNHSLYANVKISIMSVQVRLSLFTIQNITFNALCVTEVPLINIFTFDPSVCRCVLLYVAISRYECVELHEYETARYRNRPCVLSRFPG